MLATWFRHLVNPKSPSRTPQSRGGSRRQRGRRPRLERLEDRMVPTAYLWTGDFGPLWSWHENWTNGISNNGPPFGDPSANVSFAGGEPRDTVYDDFTGFNPPTTLQSINFLAGGYSLSPDPDPRTSVITLTGDITSDTSGGTSTISLPLSVSADLHHVDVSGGDTLVLSGTGNLSGNGLIYKVGPGTLVMAGDHTTFQGQIEVGAGTLQVGSAIGLGNDEPITLDPQGVLDLNNHDVTLGLGISEGEIRLGSGNLTLPHGSQIRGDITGSGGLTLSGYTEMQGIQSYTGPTRLLSGELDVNGSSAESPITISAGATLHGRGTTGALSVRGLVGPGDGQLGRAALQSNGDVTFQPGSSFETFIDGLNPGGGGTNGYDQLNVSGRVDLSGSPTLNAFVNFASHPGDSFAILQSTDGITGTFAGLPDGANFGSHGTPMQIHYTGTSVVLTHRPQFLPPVPYAVGENPAFVATGDFRGNGIKDLVTANHGEDTVSVHLGNGDGTFQDAVSYAASPNPVAMTVGDFNGDGHLDLVTVSRSGGIPTMSVLLGNGDGTFQGPITAPLDLQPTNVAAGDFNNDGSADLVIAYANEGLVSVLLSNGDGTFQPAVTYLAGFGAHEVAVGDLGNGTLDLVSVNNSTFSVFLGNGDGTFQPAMNITAGARGVALGDLNGDGQLDLITTESSSLVVVRLGNGDGTFGAPSRFSAGNEAAELAVGDFDADGKLDVVVTINNNGGADEHLVLLYGRGDGILQAPSYYLPTTGRLSSLAVDSFQGTRFPDLAAVNDAANGIVSVLLNVGDGTGAPGASLGGPKALSPRVPPLAGDGHFVTAGAVPALAASPSAAALVTHVLPVLDAPPPVGDSAGVERFFAMAPEPDHGRAGLRLRSPRTAWLGADDGWMAVLRQDDPLGDGAGLGS